MAEVWELLEEKIIHGLFVCLTIVVLVLLGIAIWHLILYYLTRSRVDSAKQIYNAINLDDPQERAISLFRGYVGSRDQYTEEALLTDGTHETVLCLLFSLGRGETGEIRLTFVDNRLVQKRQSGIW